ncbi:hypothetical protein M622_16400 [Thauera terpenica 58Eu]|uniref:Uncharacterized protein n=1 Tax=Thauera terpenica 58Eu TaxID=1348657 RepID=S9ZD13_9RHOO|nr:hypothetical protein M622_16400 [Thauera terpenica 58Eu]
MMFERMMGAIVSVYDSGAAIADDQVASLNAGRA